MSLSKRIKAAEQKRTNNSQWVEPLIPGRPAYMAPSGIDVNADSAIRMSTVYACVRLLGDTISSLPLAAYVRRGRNRISYASVYGSQPAWINKPNPEASRLEFYEQIIASLNIHGNAFILTVRDDMDEVQEVYCVHPDDVRIERPRPGEPIIYKMRDEEGTYSRILTSREMKHIPLFRLPGSLYGLGPIAAARLTIGAAMAADTYAAAYFGNAAVAGAMSFASVEAQNLSFVQHSLRPLLERIEQSMSELLPEPDGFIKFNLDALLRGTTLERFDAYTKGLREGFLSLNDVRAVEDLAPLGTPGDQFRVPLQNIDAADAPDVGLKLRAEIAASLIQVGFDPKAVTEAVGLPPMKHTGVPSTQLQQVGTIDPADPASVYEVE
jgi:phage portal protein BeeE